MVAKKVADKSVVKEFIVKKAFFEQIIRWQPNDVIKLTEERAKQIGIPKFVVPLDYKEPKPNKRFFEGKKKTDEKTKLASKTVLDKLMPGVTNGV
jgi:hypothetical protein